MSNRDERVRDSKLLDIERRQMNEEAVSRLFNFDEKPEEADKEDAPQVSSPEDLKRMLDENAKTGKDDMAANADIGFNSPFTQGETIGKIEVGNILNGIENKEEDEIIEYAPRRNAQEEPAQEAKNQPDEEIVYERPIKEEPKANYSTYRQLRISVICPKGGVGKTTSSMNIAWAFALGKLNGRPLKVLLVDADWEYGDVAVVNKISYRYTIADLVKQMRNDRERLPEHKVPRDYSRATLEKYITKMEMGPDILVGNQVPQDEALVDDEIAEAICENLSRLDYDVIIFDNSNSSKSKTLKVLRASDQVLLITTLEMATVDELKRFLPAVRNGGIPTSKIHLVGNRVEEDDKVDFTIRDILDYFKLDFYGSIPKDEAIEHANNGGISYFATIEKSGKETETTRAIKDIVNQMMPLYEDKKKGFFAKLFRK